MSLQRSNRKRKPRRQLRRSFFAESLSSARPWGERRRGLRIEPLEKRELLTATLYVANAAGFSDTTNPGNPQKGDTVNWLPSGQFAEVDNLTFGTNAFTSIQAAINAPGSSGDTIDVAAGTYTETLDVTEPITIEGAQQSAAPLTTLEAPTTGSGVGIDIDTGSGTVYVDGLTVTGFSQGVSMTSSTVQLADDVISGNSGEVFGAGISIAGGTLTVTDSTITNNTVTWNQNGFAYGGGIYVSNNGQLTVNDSTVSDNSAQYSGGGIYNSGGTLVVTGSTITKNTATLGKDGSAFGGGIVSGDGSLNVSDSTISDNSADGPGGGINCFGAAATITDSTIANNTASVASDTFEGGGGIVSGAGSLDLSDSTISGNSAQGNGGGIDGDVTTLTITNSTISGNTAASAGGGIFIESNTAVLSDDTISDNSGFGTGGIFSGYDSFSDTPPHTNVANTIIAGNSASDVSGIYATTDHDLIGVLQVDTSGFTTTGPDASIVANSATDLGLAPLAANGGPTETIALVAGSPAIDAGDNSPSSLFAQPTTDQRGYARTVSGTIDIGAFELPLVVTANPANASPNASDTVSFSATATDSAAPTVAWQESSDGGNTWSAVTGATITNSTSGSATTSTVSFSALYSQNGDQFRAVFTDSNGSVATTPAAITGEIAIATPTIESVTTVNLTYGTALDDSQLVGTADFNGQTVTGTFSYTSADGTVLSAAQGQTEAVTFTPDDTTDFTTASGTVTVNVNPYTLTYTIGNDSQTYGSPANLANDLGTTISTGVNGETLGISYASTGDTATANAGNDAITGALSNGTGLLSNYNVTLTNGTLTVNQYALSYTIGSDSRTYGTPANLAKELGTTISTGVNGETLRIYYYARTGNTAVTNVGGYAITGALSDGTGLLSNYNVTLTNGTLTVNPYAFSYTLGNDGQTYGSPANLANDLGATISIGVTGETLGISYSSTGDMATANVGGYAITGALSDGTGLLSNYNVTLTNGTLMVNPYALSYTIGSDSQTYGSPANLTKDLPSTISGVNGQTLDIAYSSTGDTATANVGNDLITGALSNGTGLLSNYNVKLTNGTLTVNPYALSYTIGNDSQTYGSPANLAKELGTTINTGVNGQTLSIAYASTGDTAIAQPGAYSITGTLANGSGLLSNYSVTLVSGTLTVEGPGANVVGGTLYLVGGNTNDQVVIQPIGGSLTGSTGIEVDANLNKIAVDRADFGTNPAHPITTIIISGFGGNDNIVLVPTLTINTVVNEGDGNDNIVLGGGNNAVTAGNGNDNLAALNGNNTVTLGNGNDNVALGNGNNVAAVGGGNDNLLAGDGNNTITLGNGNDNVAVGDGNNVVVGGAGNDNIVAGNGDNLIVGGLGHDNIQVGTGKNILIDGSVQLSQSALWQVLGDWMDGDDAQVQSILSGAVTYNKTNANTLAAGKGLDWFWDMYAKDHTDRKPADLLN